MNTLMITQVSNGYVLALLDDDSNTLDTAVASATDPRGYGSCSLVTAIESIFTRNMPVKVPAGKYDAVQAADLTELRNYTVVREDSDKAAY